MTAVGYAVLPITPSLAGITKQLNSELMKPAQAAAKRASGDMEKALADGAKRAAAEVAKARKTEQSAADAVTAAEKKLSDQRSAAQRDARAIESAELKLSAAREKGARDVTAAENALADARSSGDIDKIAAAESRLSEARDRTGATVLDRENALERARAKSSSTTEKIASAEQDVASAKDKAAEASENVIAATRRLDKAQSATTDEFEAARAELGRFQDELSRTGDEMVGTADKSSGMGARIRESLSEIGRGALLGVGAKIGTSVMSGVAATFSGGWEAALDIDTGTRVLEGLYESSESAQAMLQSLREVSSRSPIDHSSYLAASQALAYTGVQGDRAVTIMENVGLAALASGKDGDQAFSTMNDALGKMVNEGRVGMESLTQLSGAGVPILSGLAEHFGVSMEEINKMASEGAIGFEDVLSVMENATGSYFENALVAGEEASGSLSNQLSRVKDDILTSVGESVAPFLAELDFTAIADQAGALARGALPLLINGFTGIIEAVRTSTELFSDLVHWVRENRTWIIPLTTAVIATTAAYKLLALQQKIAAAGGLLKFIQSLTAVTKLQTIATTAQATAQRILNTVMNANPIMRIVSIAMIAGTALWAFFTKTDKGREIWEKFTGVLGTVRDAMMRVGEAIKSAWETTMKPALDGLWAALKVVGAILMTAVVVPFQIGWNLLSAAMQAAWELAQPVLEGMRTAFQWVGQVVSNVFAWMIDNWQLVVAVVFGPLGAIVAAAITHWDTLKVALQAVWTAISNAISWAWNLIIMPVWNAMQTGLGVLGSAFQWVWSSVIKPAWDALGAGIQWVWQSIISPTWEALKAALGIVGTFFQNTWNNVIKPAWDALGAGIRMVVDNVVRPVFDRLMDGLDLVKSAFRVAVDLIGTVWDEIREKTAAPIRFVIDTVYNKGIVAVWNKVAGWLGMDDKTLETMPLSFATGGVLPGYTPGRDVHKYINPKTGQGLELSGGEAIMRPEWTRAVGGPDAVAEMNRRARKGLPLAHARAHADGGVLSFRAGGVLPGWEMLTTDIQRAMAGSVAQAFPNQRITSGTRYRDVGAGFDNHMQGRAVDFGLPGGPLASWIAREYGPSVLELFWDPGPNMVGGAPTGAIGGHSDHVHWAMANIIDPYTGDVISQEGQGGSGTSMIGGLVRQAMDLIMDPIMGAIPQGPGLIGGLAQGFGGKLYDEFKGWVLSKVPGLGGGSSPHGDWVGTPGVEQFRGLVQRLLKLKGHDVGLTGSVLRRMNQESGGNPNAINLWDSNAAAGIPSKGLMQTIDPTFQAYKDPGYDNIWDPEANLRASMNYAMDRYGSLSAAYDRAGGYDAGGWLPPGVTMAINETGQPEAVFTNPQWTLIKSLIISTAEILDPLRLLARDGRDMVRHVDEIADNARRRAQSEFDAASLEVWRALPSELQDTILAANTAGQLWHEISARIGDKAVAWSRGEWPIGSARVPVVEPGPGWQQFRLDDSLEEVARANVDLAEAVITGELSPGNDPVANALFDIFGRDPLFPDLARITEGGSNAIIAATEAAWHAFETGETERLEEWTASNSQLTEAVLRARDAAIVTGEMVEGAVNGYLNWAMASESQGRQGSWQEYFQHYGGQYGTAQGDWLLSQVGLGGILGGKVKDSLADVLIELAQSPLLAAPEILDDSGRVIGTQLQGEAAAAGPVPVEPEVSEDPAPTSLPAPAEVDPSSVSGQSIEVTVSLPEGKSAFTAEEVESMLTKLDEDVDQIKIKVDRLDKPASVTSGLDMMV